MPKLTPLKESYKYLNFLIVFLLALLLFYVIIPRFYLGSIDFWVNISELNGAVGHFSTSVKLVGEIILMGPAFAVIYFFLMKYLISDIDEEQGKNKYYINLIEIGVVIFISISCTGHIVHVLFNEINKIYINSYNVMDTSELYSFIYYFDEWLGHHLIHIGYFGYILMALLAEFLGKEHRKLNWDEIIYTFLSSIGLCIIFGYFTYEGQAAFMMLILCTLLLIIEVLVVFKKKVNVLNYPILLATIACNMMVIGFFIAWTLVFGLKPYYPFVFQPSEFN